MKTSLFSYDLPKSLIASFPANPRDSARLLVLDRRWKTVEHKIFRDIVDYLNEGDLLVVNNTKVLPARLFGRLQTGGRIEVLLVKHLDENMWKVMARPARKLKKGKIIIFDENFTCNVRDYDSEGQRIVEFKFDGDFTENLNRIGHVPIPPYIGRLDNKEDRVYYQTIFAEKQGAVAAPTASLHFTERLLERIEEKGVNIKPITLHVGPGTFKPVKVENILQHKMHFEDYDIPPGTADEIRKTREKGKRVVAVGTTVTRALESATDENGNVEPKSGTTNLFIYPGYRFKVVDALITNFHLPRSTLLMLVSAFAGREETLNAYREAISMGYRFYSYGDAMFII